MQPNIKLLVVQAVNQFFKLSGSICVCLGSRSQMHLYYYFDLHICASNCTCPSASVRKKNPKSGLSNMNDPYGSLGPMKEGKNPLKILAFVCIKSCCCKYYFWKESSKINWLSIFSKTEPNFLDIFRYLKISKFYVLIVTIFRKKEGNYSRGDIDQRRILIKEIQYFLLRFEDNFFVFFFRKFCLNVWLVF